MVGERGSNFLTRVRTRRDLEPLSQGSENRGTANSSPHPPSRSERL